MDGTEDLSQLIERLLTKEFWKGKLTRSNFIRVLLVLASLCCLRYLGAIAASILGIVLIFWNLGERTGGASAYSVFNRGANYLLGDLRLARIDQQLRHGDGGLEDDAQVVEYRAPIEIRSRDANKRCPCGSGKKLKKCCGI
ncbi:uncharacterized protein LOC113146867 [Cyclospora cayetanensis]|uniref:Uncharacterized protein LOC113146867 n=1 Tax=Cyclospora cayetanensis TaxID=88456 RepID=A0A6P6RVX9_9EIME|nr:uncharacterized protein LOC113146867 [Cyclospora cayetanensis]